MPERPLRQAGWLDEMENLISSYKKLWLVCSVLLLLSPGLCRAEQEAETYWVGVRPSGRPYLFADTVEGRTRLRGFIMDLLGMNERLIGCNYKYLICDNMSERRQLLLQGRIDPTMMDSPSFTNDPDLHHIPLGISLQRRIYINDACKTVTRPDDLTNHRILVITGDN